MPSSSSAEALAHLAELWRRERAAARARFAEERARLGLRERVERGIALEGLEVEETDAAPGGRTRLWLRAARPGAVEASRIRQGEPVLLWWDHPDEADAVTAVVTRRGRDRLAVVVDGDAPDRVYDGGFRVDRAAPEATFARGDAALARFAAAKADSPIGRLREILYGGRAPTRATPRALVPLDPALDASQREAVAHCLDAADVALVHGPPGTGKTRTLVEVVRQAAARGERVLVTAASNTAVDNLAERLTVLGVDVVRLGHPARVSAAMEHRTLDALVEATEAWKLGRKWIAEAEAIRRRVSRRSERGTLAYRDRRAQLEEAGRLVRDARRHLGEAERSLLARARVICATAAGADARLLEGVPFDRVVIDEATQAPDPIALAAVARAPRLVLAGDPHQLPPTVIDPTAEREGLGRTLFERLVQTHGEEVVRLLRVQYRMHEDLMAFPNARTYGGALAAGAANARHRLEELEGVAADPLRAAPFVYVDAAGKGWEETRGEDDPSTQNPAQAARVEAEVRRLVSRGLRPSQISLITPYEAEARLLRGRLAPFEAEGLEIGTVDGFQGRENEAIVVDLVRSNDAGEIGFLTDVRRMNVALTRARRFLLVVGDSGTLAGHPYYAALLEHAQATGAWRSAWEDEAEPL